MKSSERHGIPFFTFAYLANLDLPRAHVCDHQILYGSLLVAVRAVPDHPVRRVFTYYVNSATEWGAERSENAFVPNVFVAIDRTVDRKLTALRAYTDELRRYPHPRSVEAVEIMARAFGMQAGFTHAEPFRLVTARERL